MQKKLLVFLLLTSSLSLQANYFARASRLFQSAKQQMMNYWSKNKTSFNVNEFKGEMPKSVQSQRASSTATLPTLQDCAQVQPTLLSRFNMFARRAVSQRHEGEEHKQNNYDHEHKQYKSNYDTSQFRPILGLTVFGFTLCGMVPEYEDPDKMEKILKEADDETKQKIIETICSDPIWFVKKYNRYFVLNKIFEYMPEAVMPYTQSLHRSMTYSEDSEVSMLDFLSYKKFLCGKAILSCLIRKNTAVIPLFIDLILQDDVIQFSRSFENFLYEICERASSEVMEKIEKAALKIDNKCLNSFVAKQKNTVDLELLFENNDCQSSKHFTCFKNQNLSKLMVFMPDESDQLKHFKAMIDQILTLEQQEQENEHYTILHAYKWPFHLYHLLDAKIKMMLHGYENTQVSLRSNDLFKVNHMSISKMKRDDLIKNGVSRVNARAKEIIKLNNILYCNAALLANGQGENTFEYLSCNYSNICLGLNLRNIFINQGIDDLYEEFEVEIKELQELFEDSSSFGAALLISMSAEMLQKTVRLVGPYGVPIEVEIEGYGKTSDVKLFLDTLREHPEKIKGWQDQDIILLHILTDDCAGNIRNSESGDYKIIPFNAADPEKYAKFEQKLNALVEKMKKRLIEKRMALNGEELETWQDELLYFNSISKKYNCLNEDDCPNRLIEA